MMMTPNDVLNVIFPVTDCPSFIEKACAKLLVEQDFSAEVRGSLRSVIQMARLISEHHERLRRVALDGDNSLALAANDLLAACKLALGAFENNNAINWDILRRAIEKAEPK